MNNKKFILNADDFGSSKATNRAVLEGYEAGILKSVSLLPNGCAFDDAINNVLPSCPELSVGVHLNLTTGMSQCLDIDSLIDDKAVFKNNYWNLLHEL